MARLAKALVEEREAFATAQFAKGLDVKQVNEELAKKYGGMKMALPRLEELKEKIREDRPQIAEEKLISATPVVFQTQKTGPSRALTKEDVKEAFARSPVPVVSVSRLAPPPVPAVKRYPPPVIEVDMYDLKVQEVVRKHIAEGKPPWGIFDL